MFNLDEELSDIDNRKHDSLSITNDSDLQNSEASTQKNNELLSTSLKESISKIDQRFSWVKKKKKISKYLAHDFDIKSELPKDTVEENEHCKHTMFRQIDGDLTFIFSYFLVCDIDAHYNTISHT